VRRGRKTKPMDVTPVVRCAIYARTSSDERLNCEFNSLHAQDESCSAFIKSQQSRGWVRIDTDYRDGGFSGKDTDRPALIRLLDDIRAGKVDVVVAYKLDRISRSLRDFLSLMELFQKCGVSCVSVTQSFDTNTPMGRLMMNVLLSFAEFEREIIGERIRDKLGAARRRGKWTGGTPILGYDVDRSGPSPILVVNPIEAARVEAIFNIYLELGALLPVVAELNRRGWRCKAWTTRDGRERGGQAFDKTRLHDLLTNPLLTGRIKHKNQVYQGEHDAIVSDEVFDRVQRQLRKNAHSATAGHRNKHGALLRGLLNCAACKRAMAHSFTTKRNRRYCSYRCTNAMKKGRAACPGRSIPAGEIERAVIDEIRVIAGDSGVIRETCRAARIQVEVAIARLERERRGLERARGDGQEAQARIAEIDAELVRQRADLVDEKDVVAAFADFDKLWAAMTPRERAEVIHLLVARVDFDSADSAIEIAFHTTGIQALADKITANAEAAA
jgi:site-specific DNA recombinase